MANEISGCCGLVIHHVHDRWSMVLMGAGVIDQMPAGPSNVFDVNAAEHLARFVDYACFALPEGTEHRASRAVAPP